MKKILSVILSIVLILHLCSFFAFADDQAVLDLDAPSAILMERSSGEILYSKDADQPRPLASVTKIMTLLLIMESLEAGKFTLDDQVVCSANAASMGGSQVYLKEGESLTVNDMLKAIVIASANDAAVAMAEFVSGSLSSFVALMNERAKELEMKNTKFVNCTGLDAEGHFSTAGDIAIMSRELLSHTKIKEYTTIWTDTLRDGTFGLSNTNKLVRFYKGCTGLKTGSTSKALYCISASAERDGMELIAVVLGASTSAKRFEDAKKMLNFGFAGYEIYRSETKVPENVNVKAGKKPLAAIEGIESINMLVGKGMSKGILQEISLTNPIIAPMKKGEQLGKIELVYNGEIIQTYPINLSEDVEKANVFNIFLQIIHVFLTV